MPPRLYADNAATSFPKPPCVIDAMRDYAERLGASAGRGAYREAVETGEIVARCRRGIARIINAEDPRQVVFGLNCTDMLNLAIHGVLRAGDHAVATRMEHNSVLRPLHALRELGIDFTLVDADAEGFVAADAVIRAIRPTTRLVAVQHASNVTGTIQPIAEIGRATRERDVLFLVDAAQTLGHVPIDVRALSIDLLAFPGHKGLFGPLGTAGLYIRPGVERRVRPQRQGGTGSVSETRTQPDFMPDRYESGSQNAIGLAGLCAAVEWILERGVESLWRHDQELSAAFLQGLGLLADGEHGRPARSGDALHGEHGRPARSGDAIHGEHGRPARSGDAIHGEHGRPVRANGISIDPACTTGLSLYGPRDPSRRVSVFSLCVDGIEPAELSALLESEFGFLTRSGIACAPLAHETLGTAPSGAMRISFSAMNSIEDVRRAADAIVQLSAGMTPAVAAQTVT